MSGSTHHFRCTLDWTGAANGPIRDYESYSREVAVQFEGRQVLRLSGAPAFRGDGSLHNPEDLLVASLATCHFLTYAAYCARRGVVMTAYRDEASGTLSYDKERKVMAMSDVLLRPHVTIAAGSDVALALRLHENAHHECFIANSVNFPVRNEPTIVVAGVIAGVVAG